MLELRTNNYTHFFDKEISNKIFEIIPIKECKFCGSKLDPDTARFYQHSGGWQTSIIKEKVWIWFTCTKCNHGWSISKLGLKGFSYLDLNNSPDKAKIINVIPDDKGDYIITINEEALEKDSALCNHAKQVMRESEGIEAEDYRDPCEYCLARKEMYGDCPFGY